MKISKFAFSIMALFVFASAFISCGNKSASSASEKQSMEYASAYVCPMHCKGSGSDQEGKCPVCGMDYVKNPDLTHACSMHPEVTGVKGDKCSKCGMDLTEAKEDAHKGHNH